MATLTRIRVEQCIAFRVAASGDQEHDGKTGFYEVEARDAEGSQRRHKVSGGITAARRKLTEVKGARDRGEQTAANPRLRFGAAADAWLAGPMQLKSENTRQLSEQMVRRHLRPRFANQRLDRIDANAVVQLIAELRANGYSEATISHAVHMFGRVFKFAARRLGGPAVNPVAELLSEERPKPAREKKRIYENEELEQTIAAAATPDAMLLRLAAVTGARQSELLGLRWAGLDTGPSAFMIRIESQVSRSGEDAKLKTRNSYRQIQIPAELAAKLREYQSERALQGYNVGPTAYVFATRTGRPLNQRNVARALRRAQKRARTKDGLPTFPALHEERKLERGELPDFHSLRHLAASRYIADGWDAVDVADLLGDDPKTVLSSYRQQLTDAKRARLRADRMATTFASVLA